MPARGASRKDGDDGRGVIRSRPHERLAEQGACEAVGKRRCRAEETVGPHHRDNPHSLPTAQRVHRGRDGDDTAAPFVEPGRQRESDMPAPRVADPVDRLGHAQRIQHFGCRGSARLDVETS